MQDEHKSLAERLAVIETRVEVLPTIDRKLDKVQDELTGLRVRVAGISAGAAFLTAIAVQFIVKLLGA